ncbi:NAD(P)/FAD-dependent oxidoreductase [Methylobacterium sp. J-090]|uniref:NAD(P)/FAD-dependent oxidoreductase n=1 Tax=Methylobacterium sp. J-090 TaxID=2836666 RepID=UPI001FBC1413|nr:NAD(P)/FAD-dependent oxidoreductase [Methylobacterium sp. J-090]MCJ2083062.1 NAD(P)/FAD-dependent oxidoreductase [Methylobacterium sp. J-090]
MSDVLVIGAGVVGLAVARALARRGHAVVVAEAEGGIGTGVSARSSEVIHVGMYYPEGSLRARHCVAGAAMLYAFCASHGVPHRACGKLIVATDETERAAIAKIHARGAANGVEGLILIDGTQARALEPNLACVAALHAPGTGIVDSHALMLALQGDLEDRGGAIAFHSAVAGLGRADGAWIAIVNEDELPFDAVVNAAGLGAQGIAARVAGYPIERIPRRVLAKGSYFGCLGRPAFSRLIYPAPVEGGLGIHLTLDLAGRMRFGPDVEWVETEDYAVDSGRTEAFARAIRRYWPGLPDGVLTPDYAGIRPKLTGPGEPALDFVIDGPAEHGLAGLVHLFGIESPGLTSSLSLAEEVADRLFP